MRARLEVLLKANAAPRCGARSKRTGSLAGVASELTARLRNCSSPPPIRTSSWSGRMACPSKKSRAMRRDFLSALYAYCSLRRARFLRSGGTHLLLKITKTVLKVPNQFSGQHRQAIVMAISPTVLNREVPTLDQTRFTQGLPKPCHTIGIGLRRAGTEETNYQHRLLRARCERPRRCRTAERG